MVRVLGVAFVRVALAVAACASGLTLVTAAGPAQAVSTTECAFEGTLSLSPGGTFPPTGPPGSFSFTALALACAGRVTGTGIMTVSGTYAPSGTSTNIGGTLSLTVSTTTCTGTLGGAVTALVVVANANTTCGPFTVLAVVVPTTLPPVTSAQLVGAAASATTGSCVWAAASSCSYTADSSSARAVVISPSQPTVTGGSASWTQVPVPGAGTSVWTSTISQSFGATVTVTAAANTSGGAFSLP